MKWVLICLTLMNGWHGVTFEKTEIATFSTKAECEKQAVELQKKLDGQFFCGEVDARYTPHQEK